MVKSPYVLEPKRICVLFTYSRHLSMTTMYQGLFWGLAICQRREDQMTQKSLLMWEAHSNELRTYGEPETWGQ